MGGRPRGETKMKRAAQKAFSAIVLALAMLAVAASAASADDGAVLTSSGASLTAFPDDPGYGP